MFVFIDVANAAVIRSGGGSSSLSRQFSSEWLYFNNSFLNEFGVASDFNGNINLGNVGARASSFGEGNDVRLFPNTKFGDGTQCYRDGVGVEELNAKREELDDLTNTVTSFLDNDDNPPTVENGDDPNFVRDYNIALDALNETQAFIDDATAEEPCKWQYTKGEELSIFGSFAWLFDGLEVSDISYGVNYEIAGKSLAGSIAQTRTETPFGTKFPGSVGIDLAANALDEIAAGEYDISVRVSVSSNGNGQFFRLSNGNEVDNDIKFVSNPADGTFFNTNCKDDPTPNSTEIICGVGTAKDGGFGDLVSSKSSISWSATARIEILDLGGQDNEPNKVSSAGHVSLFLLGFSLIGIRRFKRAV